MRGHTLVLREGRFLDPSDGTVTEGDMALSGGRIEEVGDLGSSYDEELDLRGRTVVPGLIDAHFHAYAHAIGGIELETRQLSYVAINAERRLARALSRGFTTIRDVAGGDRGLQQALETGSEPSARYLFSGRALSQTGGHADARSAEYDICFTEGHVGEVVDGVDAVRRAVRERFRTGSHCIKVMASGGVVSPTDPLRIPQYSPEEIRVACEEAARRGSYVAAHAYTADAVIHSVVNGVTSVEHGNLLDQDAASIMAEHETFLVPTLAAYDAMSRRADEVGLSAVGRAKNAEVLDAGQHAVSLAQKAGVKVGFGSDLMGDLEDDQLRGIALQAQAQSAEQLLRSLTVVNAELIGRPSLGSLKAGTEADLLILPADPMHNPEGLWSESPQRQVIRAGVILG